MASALEGKTNHLPLESKIPRPRVLPRLTSSGSVAGAHLPNVRVPGSPRPSTLARVRLSALTALDNTNNSDSPSRSLRSLKLGASMPSSPRGAKLSGFVSSLPGSRVGSPRGITRSNRAGVGPRTGSSSLPSPFRLAKVKEKHRARVTRTLGGSNLKSLTNMGDSLDGGGGGGGGWRQARLAMAEEAMTIDSPLADGQHHYNQPQPYPGQLVTPRNASPPQQQQQQHRGSLVPSPPMEDVAIASPPRAPLRKRRPAPDPPPHHPQQLPPSASPSQPQPPPQSLGGARHVANSDSELLRPPARHPEKRRASSNVPLGRMPLGRIAPADATAAAPAAACSTAATVTVAATAAPAASRDQALVACGQSALELLRIDSSTAATASAGAAAATTATATASMEPVGWVDRAEAEVTSGLALLNEVRRVAEGLGVNQGLLWQEVLRSHAVDGAADADAASGGGRALIQNTPAKRRNRDLEDEAAAHGLAHGHGHALPFEERLGADQRASLGRRAARLRALMRLSLCDDADLQLARRGLREAQHFFDGLRAATARADTSPQRAWERALAATGHA